MRRMIARVAGVLLVVLLAVVVGVRIHPLRGLPSPSIPRVYLVGMMGSGKTTIGKLLAEKVRFSLVDTDELVEQTCGKTVADIFGTEGESAFRKAERQAIAQTARLSNSVVSTGGGAILSEENWQIMHSGAVVFLDVEPDVLCDRLLAEKTLLEARPILKCNNPRMRLKHLLDSRRALYGRANFRVAIDVEDTPEEVANAIVSGILRP